MTNVCISFAGSSGLGGFPAFPQLKAQQLQEEFPTTHITLTENAEQRRAALADADIVFAVRFSPDDFKTAKRLKWLQLSSAGATHVLFPEMVASDILVTNSRGLYGVPIAEHVIGLMIILARNLHEAYRFQLEGKWPREEMFARSPQFLELHGSTAGVIGLGDIGLAVAERAKALGMRVLASKRHVGAKPACVDELLGTEGLSYLLRESDFVIIAAPLTPDTQGLIGETALRTMKPSAYLFNVGRGAIIQEAVLIRALQEGWIAGAGLDVTEVEPLPANSPLFHLPNVIITPHYSGLRPKYWDHAVEIFRANLVKFLRGEPLDKVVDKRSGY